jgi:hypothetical protein
VKAPSFLLLVAGAIAIGSVLKVQQKEEVMVSSWE